jgi:hypothetical protein
MKDRRSPMASRTLLSNPLGGETVGRGGEGRGWGESRRVVWRAMRYLKKAETDV